MSPGTSSNLILTGFMGTGKTIVGRLVAQQLGRPFLDMDAEIEARAGQSIASIFSQDGEVAFRALEKALCLHVSRLEGHIVATGGGAVVDPANRERIAGSGQIVCLTAGVDQVLDRIAGTASRPLLQAPDPRTAAERLLREREEAYAAIPWQIDTTGLSPEQVAAQVLPFAEVRTLTVHHAAGAYPIHIGSQLLPHTGGALRSAGAPHGSRVAVVSNPVVAPLYRAPVEPSLRAAGFEPVFCSVPDGEQHKTLATVAGLYEQFLAGGLDRHDAVLALGGGVTGDIAGLAAATYLRGIRFAQVPTTLLAMVDASVGGKTGVDLPAGKNLIGAFKQPAVVLIDPAVLGTLPPREVRAGIAETIKHGIIDAPDLFTELENGPAVSLDAFVISSAQLARALEVKTRIVEQDPLEQSRRAVLNLGHTVGHGLERLSAYQLRHGEAVAIGIVAASRLAAAMGLAAPDLIGRIEAGLQSWGLPVRCPPVPFPALWDAMAHDKKRRGRSLRWVLPRRIGEATVDHEIPLETVRAVLIEMGAVDRTGEEYQEVSA
jgi:shikimate kinase / 3-dehydroquinate synthase